MALNTSGFTLSALPRSPEIPSNIGKIDPKAVYDAAVQALRFGQESAVSGEQLGANRSNLLAQSALNARTQALASPEIVGQEVEKTKTGLDADLAAEQTRRNVEKTRNKIDPSRILAGPMKSSSSNTTINPNGSFTSTGTQNVDVGLGATPVESETSTSPGFSQFPGMPGGAIIGPGGKATFAPAGLVNGVMKSKGDVKWVNMGDDIDKETGAPTGKISWHGIQKDHYGNVTTLDRSFAQGIDPNAQEAAAASGSAPLATPPATPVGNAPLAAPRPTPAQVKQQLQEKTIGAQATATQKTQTNVATEKEIREAQAAVPAQQQAANEALAQIAEVSQTVQEYTSGDLSQKWVNRALGVIGTSGINKLEGNIDQAASSMVSTLKAAGINRFTNVDILLAKNRFPNPNKDNGATMLDKVENLGLMGQWTKAVIDRKADYLQQGWQEGRAGAQAIKDCPLPTKFQTAISSLPQYTPNPPQVAGAEAAPSGPAPQEGDRRQGKTTGVIQVFQNGQWVKESP